MSEVLSIFSISVSRNRIALGATPVTSQFTTSLTDCCSGNYPLSQPEYSALQNNSIVYHPIGPISNFAAAMIGCCGNDLNIYDGGIAPSGFYYYCLLIGNHNEWPWMRNCISERPF
jgi:hypothetical protein